MPYVVQDAGTQLPVSRANWIDTPTRLRIIAHLNKYMEDARSVDPNFSQTALAKKLGVSQGYLSKVMAGIRLPGLDLVLRINRKLFISLDLLVNMDPGQSGPKRPH